MRGILTAFLAVFLVGFGLCGAYGTIGGLANAVGGGEAAGMALLFVLPGLVGIGLAWLCWKAIASIWRKPAAPAE